jgi:hypothetical protein
MGEVYYLGDKKFAGEFVQQQGNLPTVVVRTSEKSSEQRSARII